MIYSYEECQKKLDSFDNTIIRETTPLGYTSLEKLPIRHFTLGNGSNHIVVSASQHSNEIITTSFVINLMEYLIKNYIFFEDLTIHFIPILNPEGYLVNTSAIRNKLAKNSSLEQEAKFSLEYYKKYKNDILNKDRPIKEHQELFNDTNHKSIDKKYQMLTDSVQEILSNHPKGSIIDWASNGNGIDLNSNSVNKQVSLFEYNRQNVYNNIRIDIPSPIGHPGKTNIPNFEEEIELSSLRKLFEKLNKENNLLGYLNYHSVGGLIYQRPEDNNNVFSIAYNYLLSKFYQEYTIKNDSHYDIITKSSGKISSVNDDFRVKYPGNILIELSPMGGNPIGGFGDINNYTRTIEGNIQSFIYTMKNITKIYKVSKQLASENTSIDDIYPTVDKTYEDIKRKH